MKTLTMILDETYRGVVMSVSIKVSMDQIYRSQIPDGQVLANALDELQDKIDKKANQIRNQP